MNIKHTLKYWKYEIWDGEWCVDVRWYDTYVQWYMHVRCSERQENKQDVTRVKGEMDQVMLMGWNCSLMDCKIGCHWGLMDGAAWLRLSEGSSTVIAACSTRSSCCWCWSFASMTADEKSIWCPDACACWANADDCWRSVAWLYAGRVYRSCSEMRLCRGRDVCPQYVAEQSLHGILYMTLLVCNAGWRDLVLERKSRRFLLEVHAEET